MAVAERYNLFRRYYIEQLKPEEIVLPDIQFRHFRLELFYGKPLFERLRDVFRTREKLYAALARMVPRNAFFTPVKWLNPIYVRKSKKELDVMLSFPLFFDIDMKQLEKPTFDEAKNDVEKLIDYIKQKYGLSPDLVVFSGRQGFHVYYWKFNKEELIKESPNKRLSEFKRRRSEILQEIKVADITVDYRVTADPYRIMRIPNTLHGETGLAAKPVRDLRNFEFEDAQVFEPEIYAEVFNLRV